MLLALRSLWERLTETCRGAGLLLGLSSLVNECASTGADVTVQGTGVSADPQIGSGTISGAETLKGTHRNRAIQRRLRRLAQWSEPVSAPIARDLVVLGTGVRASPRVGNGTFAIDVVLRPLPSASANTSIIGTGTVNAEIELFDYEIAALLLAA